MGASRGAAAALDAHQGHPRRPRAGHADALRRGQATPPPLLSPPPQVGRQPRRGQEDEAREEQVAQRVHADVPGWRQISRGGKDLACLAALSPLRSGEGCLGVTVEVVLVHRQDKRRDPVYTRHTSLCAASYISVLYIPFFGADVDLERDAFTLGGGGLIRRKTRHVDDIKEGILNFILSKCKTYISALDISE